MTLERTFTMELTPAGWSSSVLLDGVDISELLRGVSVSSDVHGGTVVTLRCSGRLGWWR
jgi:hypothetical protein